jgi:hypothetical protein
MNLVCTAQHLLDVRPGRREVQVRESAFAAAMVLCACCTGCAGDGDGLDPNGRPEGEEPPPPLVAEFQSIQDNVLTPICTTCHSGAAAPLGLRLDADASYAMLVNAPSAEVPGLLRVEPGDPDASYLVQKLEGSAAVGARMPLDGPPLPRATIDVLRQWIVDGALPPDADATASAAAVQLAALDPAPGAALAAAPASLLIAANGELDTTRIDTSTVRVERSGGDGRFDDGNESTLANLQIEIRSVAPTVLAIRTRAAWHEDHYRLVIAGSGADPVSDRGARLIDGDGDGSPGGDFVLEFEVRTAQ